MKQTLISGAFTLAAVVLAAFLPLILPTSLGASRPLILFSKLETTVSPDLLVPTLQGQDVSFLGRRLTVVKLRNVSGEDLRNFQIEVRLNVSNGRLGTGMRPGRSFLSSAARIAPVGDNSFLISYALFPQASEHDVFFLSDDDFTIVDLIPSTSRIQVLEQNESLLLEASNRRWRHYILGSLATLGVLSLAWFILTLLGRRIALPRKAKRNA